MLRKPVPIHVLIRCEGCELEIGNNRNGILLAGQHHKKTGHRLTGEVAYQVIFDKEGEK
jgi:hypothetical protein